MGATYRKILQELLAARDAQYRSDPERLDALLQAVIEALQVTLEKLSEQESASHAEG